MRKRESLLKTYRDIHHVCLTPPFLWHFFLKGRWKECHFQRFNYVLCLYTEKKKKNLRFDVCVRRMRKLYSSWATRTISTTPSLLFLGVGFLSHARHVSLQRSWFKKHFPHRHNTQMKLRWHIELTRYFYSLVIAYNVSFSNCWRMDRALHLECPSTLLTSR